jgi:hypothetical protein
MSMNLHRRRALHGALALVAATWAGAGQAAEPASKPGSFRNLPWAELIPKDWDAMKFFRERPLGYIREGDAREQAMMQELREAWDNAPTRPELNGAAVRLPGYVVPLDATRGEVREFLLVPYFGACIHSPPPPANQIVHVHLPRPLALRSMDTVWVSGTLRTQRKDSEVGVSGYQLEAVGVEAYRAPAR